MIYITVFLLCPPLNSILSFFFFNDTATTEIYTLSLHDALPISSRARAGDLSRDGVRADPQSAGRRPRGADNRQRSEEHTSELQSQSNLVCRLLLEKKKKKNIYINSSQHRDLRVFE